MVKYPLKEILSKTKEEEEEVGIEDEVLVGVPSTDQIQSVKCARAKERMITIHGFANFTKRQNLGALG